MKKFPKIFHFAKSDIPCLALGLTAVLKSTGTKSLLSLYIYCAVSSVSQSRDAFRKPCGSGRIIALESICGWFVLWVTQPESTLPGKQWSWYNFEVSSCFVSLVCIMVPRKCAISFQTIFVVTLCYTVLNLGQKILILAILGNPVAVAGSLP